MKTQKMILVGKGEYETLLKCAVIAKTIYALMGDFIEDKYKKEVHKIEELERSLSDLAKDFNLQDAFEENQLKLEGKFYNDLMDDFGEFEEWVLNDKLSNKLAWRDFERDYSKAERDAMAKKNGGYFGVALYDYEKKYWDEFEKYDYQRLEIKR